MILKKMKKRKILLALTTCLAFNLQAQGDLLLSPIRVVFEGNKQNQELVMVNTGSDTATYIVSFIQNRMTDSGNYERIESPDSGQYFASDYIRFFPRKFTLAPGEPQTLRMQFRRRTDMIDGEYRSHLHFRNQPAQKELGAEKSETTELDGISISLIPIYGVSIPVILRTGETNVKITSGNLEWEMKDDTTGILRFTLFREGNISVYGNINILYDGPGNRSEILKVINGTSIFTPNKQRKFEIEIPVPEDLDINTGKITVRYYSSNDAKPETFSTAELRLGN